MNIQTALSVERSPLLPNRCFKSPGTNFIAPIATNKITVLRLLQNLTHNLHIQSILTEPTRRVLVRVAGCDSRFHAARDGDTSESPRFSPINSHKWRSDCIINRVCVDAAKLSISNEVPTALVRSKLRPRRATIVRLFGERSKNKTQRSRRKRDEMGFLASKEVRALRAISQ